MWPRELQRVFDLIGPSFHQPSSFHSLRITGCMIADNDFSTGSLWLLTLIVSIILIPLSLNFHSVDAFNAFPTFSSNVSTPSLTSGPSNANISVEWLFSRLESMDLEPGDLVVWVSEYCVSGLSSWFSSANFACWTQIVVGICHLCLYFHLRVVREALYLASGLLVCCRMARSSATGSEISK